MYLIMGIILMAVVTYMTRVLPLTLYNKKVQSAYLRSFLYYVPYAVLGAMTFPHVLYVTNHKVGAMMGMLVAIVLGYAEKSLITVALTAVMVVYLYNILL